MRRKPSILLAFFPLCFLISAFRVAAQSNEQLSTLIKEQFDTLKLFAREVQATLSIDYTAGVTSESISVGSKISINVPQLQNIIDKVGSKYTKDLVRLVIAHELGHQIQYRYYNNINGSRLFECQADIIAGFLLYQVSGREVFQWGVDNNIDSPTDPRMVEKLEELKSTFYAALTAIFDQGNNYLLRDFHPGTEERRLALRDGMAYGNLWLSSEIMNNPDFTGNTPESIQKSKETAAWYKAILNFLPGDNLITWSYRHAKKIIHQRTENCRDIIVYIDYEWNTNSSHPYIQFRENIKNVGTKTLTLTFYNQLYTVLRKDPSNTLYWDLRATKSYTITLQPGASRSINDSMQWVSSGEFMPSFIFAGGTGSLYVCTSLKDAEEKQEAGSHNYFNGEGNPTSARVLDNFIASRMAFKEYIGGIGLTLTPNSDNDIYYISKVKTIGSTKTSVHYNASEDLYSIEAEYPEVGIKTVAKRTVDQIIKDLQALEHEVIPNPEDTGNSWLIREGEEIIGGISISSFQRNGSRVYSVYLFIDGQK